MKRTFIRRLTSTIVALSMISVPMPTGTFAVEPDISTPGTSVTNIDTETKSESGGVKSSSPETTTERGGFPDGTGEPAETTAPAETSVTSVTEPPAETEVTTVTGETTAETTAHTEDTSGDTSNTDETDMNTQETTETESDIELMSLDEDGNKMEHDKEFKPLDISNAHITEAGNYYLSGDISSSLIIDTVGDVNLCLHDHSITGLVVVNVTTLNIYDDKGAGKISSSTGINCMAKEATINIYGGTITGESTSISNMATNINVYGGTITSDKVAIYNSGSGNINILGGTIKSSERSIFNPVGGSINISGGTIDGCINLTQGTLTISGNPVITGNAGIDGVIFLKGGSINLSGSPTITGKDGSSGITIFPGNSININGELTPYDPIKIAMQGVETTYLFAVMEEESYATADIFESVGGDYQVVKNGKKLYLTTQETHEHEDGTKFTPWLDTEGLPTTSGYYYLTEDVTMGEWALELKQDAEINLCLNGKNVYTQGTNLAGFGVNLVLSIYDDEAQDGYFVGGINVYSGTLNVYGGKIHGGDVPSVCVQSNCTANLYGGIFESQHNCIESLGTTNINGGTYSGSISVQGDFNLSKDIDLTGYFRVGTQPIHITGQLNKEYSIEMNSPGLFAVMDDEDFASAKNFTPVGIAEAYTVVQNGKKLYLTDQGTHSHEDGTEFTPWLDNENLPTEPGKYYLTGNVKLTDTWNVPTGKTNICLNGNTISTDYIDVLNVGDGADLTIFDCKNAGEIKSDYKVVSVSGGSFTLKNGKIKNDNGNLIDVSSGGTVTIENGTVSSSNGSAINGVSGSNIIIKGGTISGSQASGISAGGKIEISGGEISGDLFYGVDAGSATEFILSGNPNISVNGAMASTSADIHVSPQPITINGPLTGGTYSIHMDDPGVFATGDYAEQSKDKFTPSSELTNDGYAITVTEAGELALTKHEHNGIKFMPWTETTKLPDKAGNWYLTEDVKIPEGNYSGWKVPTGETNLCLNGHIISDINGNQIITVNNDVTLNIYDDDGKEGSINAHEYAIKINSGRLTLDGVNISSEKYGINNYLGVVKINNSNIHSTDDALYTYGGTIVVTGGTITTTKDYRCGVSIISDAAAELNDVEIILNSYSSKGIDAYASQVTLNDCNITANENMTECIGINATSSSMIKADGCEITVGEDKYSYGISSNSSTVKLTNSHIKGGSNGIRFYEGTLEISGNSSVETKTGEYGVYFDEGTFKLSGNPEITGGKAGIYLDSGKVITIDGELSGTYTIDMRTPGVFTSGAEGNAAAANFAPSAELQKQGYEVTEQDGELALTLKTYTITYLPGGTDVTGTIEHDTKTHGQSVNLSENKFKRLGYTQVGWTTSDGGTIIDTTADGSFEKTNGQYVFGDEFKDDNDITLYPIWMKNKIVLDHDIVERDTDSYGPIDVIATIQPSTADSELTWSYDESSDLILKCSPFVRRCGII